MDKINELKLGITVAVAALTALWGWYGWFVVLLAVCMVLDYLTGTAAGVRAGEWNSKAARDGIWHKVAIIVAVIVASVLDAVVALIITNIPSISLPFTYEVLFGPIVVAWYILTELGSILENAGNLGGKQPAWFRRAVQTLQGGVDKVGDKLADEKEEQ